MAHFTAIGLMSGTSMDGIDVALIRTDGEQSVERLASEFFPFPAALTRRLATCLEEAKRIEVRTERPGILAKTEQQLDQLHEDHLLTFAADHQLDKTNVDVIGYHGQTVLHRPEEGLTVQLGTGEYIANATLVPVVYDMRANDMLHGGQGAPLAPAYHSALAHSLPKRYDSWYPVAFVNIGGIANITWIAPGHDPFAFDTGPGNALIDQWVSVMAGIPFDDGGRIATEGKVVRSVVEKYLQQSFFKLQAPKSLDRLDFDLGPVEGLELSDGARTLAAVTAESIYAACDHLPEKPGLWILCGGGRKNPIIAQDLADLAKKDGAQVILAEDAGLNGDSMEAEAWAYLAVRSLRRLPLTWPTTTGCNEPVSGGILVKPDQTVPPREPSS